MKPATVGVECLCGSSVRINVHPAVACFFQVLNYFPDGYFHVCTTVRPVHVCQHRLITVINRVELLLIFFKKISFVIAHIFKRNAASFHEGDIRQSAYRFDKQRPFHIPVFPYPEYFHPAIPEHGNPCRHVKVFPYIDIFLYI